MNKKMRARKRRQARRVALTLVLMLTVALVSIGGTIAWLTDETNEVKNTFTVGNINIDLYESDENGDPIRAKSFDLIPGNSYFKDPKVVVAANSEDCYLFVKVVTAGDIEYVEYELNMDSPWTELNAGSGIYYREVTSSDEEQSWYLLKNAANLKDEDGNDVNGSVKISTSLTKEILDSTANPFEEPSISFTAYAVQKDNLTVQEAWNVAQGLNPDGTAITA